MKPEAKWGKDEVDAPRQMRDRPPVFKRLCLSILLPAAACLLPASSFCADLTAADILRAVREGQAGRHETLEGQLRNSSDGKTFPFRLVADGPSVRYQFAGSPATTVQVQYNEENSELLESVDGAAAEKLTRANFDRKILGTDLTYEDMALRFVYWSRSSLLEDDHATTFPAFKLRLNAPGKRTQYAYVLLWVHKDTSALLQAEGYDEKDRLLKRFTVVSGQKIGGKWYLKQMRVENVNPDTGRVATRTYLEIKGLAK